MPLRLFKPQQELVVVFFFQAEDGIRDYKVTGVQTCALPISTSKLKKIGFLAEYLRTLSEEDLRAAAVFFTGRPFPLTDARTLNVGWSAIMNEIGRASCRERV